MTLLDHINAATTKKFDFKNLNLTSVGAMNLGDFLKKIPVETEEHAGGMPRHARHE
jgi:hypothetical protein